jgi:hypothetical protein
MNWFINFATEGNTWINVEDISSILEDRENRCGKVLMKSGSVFIIDAIKQVNKGGETNWQRFVRLQKERVSGA